MDGLSAFSLAGTILQIVDFGLKTLSILREVRVSANGTSNSNTLLQQRAQRLSELSTDLGSNTKAGDRVLRVLGDKCHAQAEELQALIVSLHTSKHEKLSASVKATVQSLWKEKDVQRLEQALEKSRDELLLHLSASVYQQQSELATAVDWLIGENRGRNAQNEEHAQEARDAILDRLEELLNRKALDQQGFASPENSVTKLFADLSLDTFLSFLALPNDGKRYSNIPSAHSGTFDWIFEHQRDGNALHLKDWLQCGHGIFWITGKPGCGKSTLMKHLSGDVQLRILMKHNGGRAPIVCKFFFWVGNSRLERSQEGLIRSLLIQILNRAPEAFELIKNDPSLANRLGSSAAGTPSALQNLFTDVPTLVEILIAVIRYTMREESIIILIDGADEFKGPPQAICDTIHRLAYDTRVNICVSSRPWNQFDSAFGGDASKVLRVHEYTKKDIRIYVQDLLEKHETFQRLRQTDPAYEGVISTVVERSQGVFLWVFLVVRNIRDNLPNEDTIDNFKRRVEDFPDDLESYFARMFGDIPTIYQEESARIVVMLLAAHGSVEWTQLCYVLDPKLDPRIRDSTKDLAIDLHALFARTSRRLNAHCKDLVSINAIDMAQAMCTCACPYEVGFLHRTVIDFLNLKRIRKIIWERVPDKYNAALDLCASKLMQIDLSPCKCTHPLRQPHGGMLDGGDLALEDVVLRDIPQTLWYAQQAVKTGANEFACFDLVNKSSDRLRTIFAENGDLRPSYEASIHYVGVEAAASPTMEPHDRRAAWEQAAENDLFALTAATNSNFNAYVDFKLDQSNRHKVSGMILRNALLYEAFKESSQDLSRMTGLTRNTFRLPTSLDTVEILLQHGADPNAEIHTHKSVWISVLTEIGRKYEAGELKDKRYHHRLLSLLLQHGANPKQSVLHDGVHHLTVKEALAAYKPDKTEGNDPSQPVQVKFKPRPSSIFQRFYTSRGGPKAR